MTRVRPVWFVTAPLAAVVVGGAFGMLSRSPSGPTKPEPEGILGDITLRRPLVTASSPSSPPSPTAESLVADSRAAYRAASTYQDVTTVDDQFIILHGGTQITHVDAAHAFVRPSSSSASQTPSYRVDYKVVDSTGDREAVTWERDGAVKTFAYGGPYGVNAYDSLKNALVAPSAISHGATTTVAGLLRDDVQWKARGLLGRLAPPLVVVGVDRLDGVECWVIDGKPNRSLVDKFSGGTTAVASLWIGRDDHVVHRYEARGPDGDEVIAVKPTLNEIIAPSRFEFTPPL